MNFAIGLTEYFQSLGFDTTHWRKSLDGTQAVVHLDTVALLIDDAKVEIYRHDDDAFKEILTSDEWTEKEGEDINE